MLYNLETVAEFSPAGIPPSIPYRFFSWRSDVGLPVSYSFSWGAFEPTDLTSEFVVLDYGYAPLLPFPDNVKWQRHRYTWETGFIIDLFLPSPTNADVTTGVGGASTAYFGGQGGYASGFDNGYISGLSVGSGVASETLDNVRTEAYGQGYTVGYNDGLNTEYSDIDPFTSIKNGVDNVLSIRLFGDFTFGTLLLIAIGLTFFFLLLKTLK